MSALSAVTGGFPLRVNPNRTRRVVRIGGVGPHGGETCDGKTHALEDDPADVHAAPTAQAHRAQSARPRRAGARGGRRRRGRGGICCRARGSAVGGEPGRYRQPGLHAPGAGQPVVGKGTGHAVRAERGPRPLPGDQRRPVGVRASDDSRPGHRPAVRVRPAGDRQGQQAGHRADAAGPAAWRRRRHLVRFQRHQPDAAWRHRHVRERRPHRCVRAVRLLQRAAVLRRRQQRDRRQEARHPAAGHRQGRPAVHDHP